MLRERWTVRLGRRFGLSEERYAFVARRMSLENVAGIVAGTDAHTRFKRHSFSTLRERAFRDETVTKSELVKIFRKKTFKTSRNS